jgi:thiol-disulfide isomerase/thioredoxin
MSWKTNYGILPIVRRAILAIASALAFLCCLPSARAVEVGEPFPQFSAAGLEGTLPAELTGKVLVVDFWASWCAPCKASFPTLSSLQTEYAEKGLVVLGISVDEKKDAYERFLTRTKPTFTTVRDGGHHFAGEVKPPTMPTTYLVDRKGRVRFVHPGFHDKTPEALRREIVQLLEEKS